MSAENSALAADETPLSAKLDAAEISNLATQTGGASERMTASLAQHISNADDELGKVISELQEVREFLRSEAERLQREFANYEQMQQSALDAANIINQTIIDPWKSTLIVGEAQNSRTKPVLLSSRAKLKRWPPG
ncbi:MAG: hypothetical protein ACJ8DX_05860 [Xanthobacteraceae bacterium]